MSKVARGHGFGQAGWAPALTCVLWAPSWTPWIRAVVILILLIILKGQTLTF